MIGRVAPDTMNPAPLIVGKLIVSGAVPVDVTVTGSVTVDPTFTSPKLRLVVLTVTCGLGRASPAPVSLIVVLECLSALLLIVSVPIAALTVAGANVT